MADTRREHDLLGERDVPAGALYGIHTVRALENFPVARRPLHAALIHAYGAVKLACTRTNQRLGYLADPPAGPLAQACEELHAGALDAHVVVDALQGGAGTSTNMNVNEVLANRALQLLGKALGDYRTISPHDHVNKHQSTNDTYPTALKIAAIRGLRRLENELVALVQAFQEKEQQLNHVVKIGRTQLQDAVLMTLGREMSAYAEAFARDRWRVYKCEERLRVVNLGGTAIGTGVAAPRDFIFEVTDVLRTITGLGLARAENLVDNTQNADVFVEVSGILKACAANLLKVCGDLRLLSSGPNAGFGEIRLPPRQAGSSIMPGKVNPVIPEAASQAAIAVMGNDQMIGTACGLGNLELNQFLPLVADRLLDSLDLLTSACDVLRRNCVTDLQADAQRCAAHVQSATATITALVGRLGYKVAEEIAQAAAREGRCVRDVLVERGLMTAEAFDAATVAEAVTSLGERPEKR